MEGTLISSRNHDPTTADRQSPTKAREAGVLLGILLAFGAALGILWSAHTTAIPVVGLFGDNPLFLGLLTLLMATGLHRLARRATTRRPNQAIAALSIPSYSAATFAWLHALGSGDVALAFFFGLLPWLLALLAGLGVLRIVSAPFPMVLRVARGIAFLFIFFCTFGATPIGLTHPSWAAPVLAIIGFGSLSLWFVYVGPNGAAPDEVTPDGEDAVAPNAHRPFNAQQTQLRLALLSAYCVGLFLSVDAFLPAPSHCPVDPLPCWLSMLTTALVQGGA